MKTKLAYWFSKSRQEVFGSVDGSRKAALARHRRLVCQSVAFLVIMIAPVFLHRAARVNATGGVLILLGVMAAGMALAIGAS